MIPTAASGAAAGGRATGRGRCGEEFTVTEKNDGRQQDENLAEGEGRGPRRHDRLIKMIAVVAVFLRPVFLADRDLTTSCRRLLVLNSLDVLLPCSWEHVGNDRVVCCVLIFQI